MKAEKWLIIATAGFVLGVALGAAKGWQGPAPNWAWMALLAACLGLALWNWRQEAGGRRRRGKANLNIQYSISNIQPNKSDPPVTCIEPARSPPWPTTDPAVGWSVAPVSPGAVPAVPPQLGNWILNIGYWKSKAPPAFRSLLLFALAFAAGWLRMGAANRPAEAGSLRHFMEGHPFISNLAIQGRVCGEPEVSSSQSLIIPVAVSASRLGTGTWQRVTGEKIRISVISRRKRAEGKTIADDYPDLASLAAYGDQLEAMVFRAPFPAKAGSRAFDARKLQDYLRREGYAGQLMAHAKNVRITERARGNPVVERALALKGKMLWVFRREFNEPVARLSAGVILGRGREVYGASYRGRPLKEVFAETGISHILSVSGLHVSMVAGTVFGLLRKLRLPRLPAAINGSLAVWFYVLLTGCSTAAVRAGVMNSFGMIFYGLGMKPLEKAALAGLCVAAWISLLPNPLLIGAVGFQLSFGAVLALILITPRVDALLQRTGGGGLLGLGAWVAVALVLAAKQMPFIATLPGLAALAALLAACTWAGHELDAHHPALRRNGYARLPAVVRGLLATQIAIQAGLLLPLSGWYFEHFSVAGCLVNLFAIPLSNVYIQVALVCGLLGTVPVVGTWLAGWVAIPANALGTAFIELAFRGAGLFGYPAVAKPGWQTLVVYYALLALGVWWLDARWRKPRTAARQRVISMVQDGPGFPPIGRKQI